MQLQGPLLYLISVPNILLGAFILLRNIRDHINVYFASFAFTVGGWAAGLANYIFTLDTQVAQGWAQFYYISAALIAYSFFGFSLSFSGKWTHFKKSHLWFGLPSLLMVLAIAFLPEFLINDVVTREWGKEVLLDKTGYLLYTIYFSAYVIAGFIVMFRAYMGAQGLRRLYFKYVSLGLVPAFTMGMVFNLFLPFLGNYQHIWAGPLFTLIYVMFVSFAIVKHRLFDVRVIIARSLGYLLSLVVTGAIFGVVGLGLINEFIFESTHLSASQQVAFTALALTIAFLLQPLKKVFDRITNSIFYRDAYDPQLFLDQLNKALVSNFDIGVLLTNCSRIIEENIKLAYAVFVLKPTAYSPQRTIGNVEKKFAEEDIEAVRAMIPNLHKAVIITDELEEDSELKQYLRKSDIAVVARLATDATMDTEGLGYLLLGAKKSGNPYNKQDIKMIEIISNELVIAIQNALRFEEIEKFNITLQEKVDNATAQLKRTNEKLKELDETKDEFISMASHQLRTPLTSVKGYLSMVLEGDVGKVSGPQRKMIEQAFVSSQRMVYLIADLLNVSRLKTGKFVIEPKATNLAEVVEGEVEQLQDTAKARELKLSFDKPKEFPTLMLDETKIRQVIMNFIDNAIYYTPPGGKIEVNLENRGKTVECRVKDTGIGVPKAEQHNLFNKFYRANNARKARPDGTGLGLFMAKKVIIAQGGAVIFDSQEGKGSTFGFSFEKAKLLPPAEDAVDGDKQTQEEVAVVSQA